MPRYKRTVDLGEGLEPSDLMDAMPDFWTLKFVVKRKKRVGKGDRDYWMAWKGKKGSKRSKITFVSSVRWQDVLAKAWLTELGHEWE